MFRICFIFQHLKHFVSPTAGNTKELPATFLKKNLFTADPALGAPQLSRSEGGIIAVTTHDEESSLCRTKNVDGDNPEHMEGNLTCREASG